MKMIKYVLATLLLLVVWSCRTVQEVEKTKSEHHIEIKDSVNIRDSVRITDKLNVRDSVLIKDSTVVVVDEQGNVIRTELYRERERYRDLEKDYSWLQKQYHDLYLKLQETTADTVFIEHEQQLTRWEQFRLDVGGWAIVTVIIIILIVVCRRIYRLYK